MQVAIGVVCSYDIVISDTGSTVGRRARYRPHNHVCFQPRRREAATPHRDRLSCPPNVRLTSLIVRYQNAQASHARAFAGHIEPARRSSSPRSKMPSRIDASCPRASAIPAGFQHA